MSDSPSESPLSSTIEFYFDPICPFAWITSRWVVEVASMRPVDIEWCFISLAIVNEDTDYSKFPPAYPSLHAIGRRMLRMAAAARQLGGNDAVGAFYAAAGQRMHHDGVSVAVFGGEPAPDDLLESVVDLAGLDRSLLDAADDASFDDVLRAETDRCLERTGRDVGTPIITFDPGTPHEASLFGPVISSVPRSDDALELWDAVRTLSRTRGFAEIKRSLRDPITFD